MSDQLGGNGRTGPHSYDEAHERTTLTGPTAEQMLAAMPAALDALHATAERQAVLIGAGLVLDGQVGVPDPAPRPGDDPAAVESHSAAFASAVPLIVQRLTLAGWRVSGTYAAADDLAISDPSVRGIWLFRAESAPADVDTDRWQR